jgi:predicted ATPase
MGAVAAEGPYVDTSMSKVRDFITELRRRKVVRTTLVYVALAWAAIEGVTTLGPVFGASDGLVRALVVLIILGLPVAIALSWMFDVTPEGLRPDGGRDDESPVERSGSDHGAAALADTAPPISRPPPVPVTRLVGRQSELAELVDLLRGGARLVTLTGPGGTGKTRLAVAVAEALQGGFAGGSGFVSLAGVEDASDLIPTLALSFDVAEVEGREPLQGLAKLLGDREVLLVLDNLEHLLDAASEVAELLATCPGLRVLTTSRSPLKIAGEREYGLTPLAVPDEADAPFDDLIDCPAVALFVERAQQVRSDFQLTPENAEAVGTVCRRLDGLPLALELAAARVRVLEPDLLVQKLGQALEVLTTGARDLPERQRTLRATIDWSHSLLTASEQRLFRRLAVFVDGWTHEAAEAVCYEEHEAPAALDEMASLVEKALVHREETGRFGMLQTIRDYARERLTEFDEVEGYGARHARYYRDFAAGLGGGMEGDAQLQWMRRGAQEDGNLEAALSWLKTAADAGDPRAVEDGLATCGNLFMYWHIRAQHIRMHAMVEALLDARASDQPSDGWIAAMASASLASMSLGDLERAIEEIGAAQDGAAILGHDRELARLSWCRGTYHLVAGDLPRAEELLSEGVVRSREVGWDWSHAFALSFHGLAAAAMGDAEAARSRLEEAMGIQERLGDFEGKGVSLSGLAQLEMGAGDLDGALRLYNRAKESFGKVGDRPEEARVMDEMAWCTLAAGQLPEASRLFLGSLWAHDSIGSTRGIGHALFGLAATEVAYGRIESGAVLAAAADVFSEREGVVIVYPWVTAARDEVDAAFEGLSPDVAERCRREGRELSVQEAVAYAMRSEEEHALAG